MTKSSCPPAPLMCLMPGGLGVDLAEQVDIHGVVDGDEVVELSDDPHIVGVVYRGSPCTSGLRFEIVVELLGAGGEGEDLAALVDGLVPRR